MIEHPGTHPEQPDPGTPGDAGSFAMPKGTPAPGGAATRERPVEHEGAVRNAVPARDEGTARGEEAADCASIDVLGTTAEPAAALRHDRPGLPTGQAPAPPTEEEPLAYVARAGEILARSLDLNQTLEHLLALVVPPLADVCAVHLLDDNGRLNRVAVRYEGRDLDPAEVLAGSALDASADDGPVHQVLRDGRSFMSAPASEDALDRILGPARGRLVVRQLGLTSIMLVPLAARGRSIGVLGLATISRPIFRPDHQELAEELARRAALAIDSARLYQAAGESHLAAERARQRTAFLAEASKTLAASLDIRTTLVTVVELAVPLLVDSCTVVMLDEHGDARRLAVAYIDPIKPRLIDYQQPIVPIHRFPNHPIAVAIATGQTMLDNQITDETLRGYASGEYLEYMRRAKLKARLVVPLEARDRRMGALVLSMTDSGRTFDEDDVALGVELAGRAALAIDNARLYQDACEARERLERSEERLRRALSAAGMVTWEADFKTGRTFRTDLAETLYGRPNAELSDDPAPHLRLVHPDDRARMTEVSDTAVAAGDGYHVEYRTLWPDGTVRWLSGRARIFRDEHGVVSGMSGTTHDVTARKEAELELSRLLAERQAEAEELRQLHRRLQGSLEALLGIHEVGKLLLSASDLDAVGRRVLKIAVRAARLRAAVLRRRPGASGRLRLWQQVGDEHELRLTLRGATVARARALALASGQAVETAVLAHGTDAERLMAWCIPLLVKGQTVGVLEAVGEARLPDEPTTEILGSIALQASTALENARLYGEIATSERALHRLVQQLMQAQEDERRRLAYEIHDGFAQMVSGLHNLLDAYAHDFPAESEAARRRMDVAVGLASRTVSEIRRVLGGLRPTVLDDFGLERGLRAHVDALAGDGLEVAFEASLGPDRLASAVEIALFRLAQEALTNVRRHAGAEAAWLRLARGSGGIVLEVEDHGRGFDLTGVEQCDRAGEHVWGGHVSGEHLGLLSMRERIAQIGGSFEIRSRPGMGTLIRAVVPDSSKAPRQQQHGETGGD